jgi:hypothetical protein
LFEEHLAAARRFPWTFTPFWGAFHPSCIAQPWGIAEMATLYDLLEEQREAARIARRNAEFAREDSKNNPKDRRLRVAADDTSHAAAQAGRKFAETEFLVRIDEWLSRDEPWDELLVKLAPRVRGEIDDDWVAAAHLVRAGVKIPVGWRSEFSGENLNDSVIHGNSRAASAA